LTEERVSQFVGVVCATSILHKCLQAEVDVLPADLKYSLVRRQITNVHTHCVSNVVCNCRVISTDNTKLWCYVWLL